MVGGRRATKTAPRTRRGRTGTILFLVGILAVLGGTFTAGALAGRLSLRASPSAASGSKADRPAKPSPPPTPTLTFYRELTAPLTPPPPPPKPARQGPRLDAAPAEPPKRADAPPDAADQPPRDHAGRYTVQVGSYNARAQAEALRARLVAAGHEAYVAEGEVGGVTRYRVRVGAFLTAEEARQAALRLGSQAHVATYVTTR